MSVGLSVDVGASASTTLPSYWWSVGVHSLASAARREHTLLISDRKGFSGQGEVGTPRSGTCHPQAAAGPRRPIWSRSEPVSVLGAWRNALGQREQDELFGGLAPKFANCTSYEFELLAYDVVGNMAYTAGLEHTSAHRGRRAAQPCPAGFPDLPT
jgi:hypothetical protein